MVDELSGRRSSFQPGRTIRLADGQLWTLPSPIREWSEKAHSDRDEYRDLIRLIGEAEDDSERRVAELAFAIFLLGQNYRLSPSDYEQLLDFDPESRESIAWQIAIHQLTLEHLHFFLAAPYLHQPELVAIRQGLASRLRAWLRTLMPLRWRSFDSQSY